LSVKSDYIRHRLVDLGLTARDLAALSGISEPSIYNMLNNRDHVFRSSTLDKLAMALDCSPLDLIAVIEDDPKVAALASEPNYGAVGAVA